MSDRDTRARPGLLHGDEHDEHHHQEQNDRHTGHSHGVSADADARWLTGALALIAGYMAGEVTVGLLARSLALISDAAHMLTDAASIVLALVAMRLAARPASGGFTFGLTRAEILSAQANGVALLMLSAWLAYEAIRRLLFPPEVTGGLVLGTALVGIVVNAAAVWMISKANRTSLNVQGTFQHILTDLYAFVATAVAGLIMVLTGFAAADAIASLVVVALMLRAGARLVRESGRIFLEAAPAGLSPERIGQVLASRPCVSEVHDLHIWQITSGMPAASAHVLVAPGQDCHAVRADLESVLAARYRITHTTLQVDHTPDPVPPLGPHSIGHCEESHGPVHRPMTHGS